MKFFITNLTTKLQLKLYSYSMAAKAGKDRMSLSPNYNSLQNTDGLQNTKCIYKELCRNNNLNRRLIKKSPNTIAHDQ